LPGDRSFPRRAIQINVDREKCIGCTRTALAPDVMAMDAQQRRYPPTPVVEWSPADGDSFITVRAGDNCNEDRMRRLSRRRRRRWI
jgi:hypothetical protein